METVDQRLANALLGYPDDARLLIVNADDFGMFHGANVATLRAFRDGIVTSTTLMVPCPWRSEALALLRAHPELPFGVHLTAISEQPDYRWGPVGRRAGISSLVDEHGYFYPEARQAEFVERVRLDELEAEWRAQIDVVRAAGLSPTHLDSHCGTHEARPDLFEMTLGLAREYGLALRTHGDDEARTADLRRRGFPSNDHPLLDSFDLAPEGKSERYAELLRALPAGLSEWAVHPALDDAELHAVEPGSQVRATDLAFLVSDEARELRAREGVVLLSYRDLQPVWQAVRA